MPTFFNDIHPRNRHRPNETVALGPSRNEQSQRSGGNQCERIHRPHGVVIIVIGVHKLQTTVVLVRVPDAIEMGMHCRRMIVIGPRVNVLKRRHKECQH